MLSSWKGLNAEQLRAVSSGTPKTLVNACAGSGKTATAAAKVAGWLESGVDPSRILLLTFTRKAAGEMKARVLSKTGGTKCLVESGTYHSVALKMMRKDPGAFGMPCGEFSILGDSEIQDIWKGIIRKFGGETRLAREVSGAYGLAVNLMKAPGDELGRYFSDGHAAAKLYSQTKAAYGSIDFDDILAAWLGALHRGVGGAGKWTHVMVDEFQDNSELQYAILNRLGAKELFVVGDPNQCIYSFRGSAPKLMRRFLLDNPDCSEHTLSLNYRSGQSILDIANNTLAGGERPVRLRAATGGRSKTHKYSLGGPEEEADFVARAVRWRLSAGKKPSDICVLFRSGSQSTRLELALKKHGIDYRKYGGLALTETSDAKDFLCLLRAWHNPADRIAKARVSMLFPGVGRKTAEKILGGGEGEWPGSAAQAGIWISQAKSMGWPRGGAYLAGKISSLFQTNYPEDCELREERVGEMGRSCSDFPDASTFLDHYAVSKDGDESHPDGSVTISTIHSAKGLEWDDVILFGAGSEQIPSRKAAEEGGVEEERRLFYVAATRARQFLCCTYPAVSPRGTPQTFTPFLSPDGWTPLDGTGVATAKHRAPSPVLRRGGRTSSSRPEVSGSGICLDSFC